MKEQIIEIELQPINIVLRAKLLTDVNPKLCEVLIKHLPYTSVQCHAFVAGYQLYHYTPIVESVSFIPETEELLSEQPIGRVSLSALQLMPIKYGQVDEYLPANPIAQIVPEDIKLLKKAGKEVFKRLTKTKELVFVTVRLVGSKEKKAVFVFDKTDSKKVNTFLEKIYGVIEKTYTKAPQELVDIFEGKIEKGIGTCTYDQYFGAMVFINGELRQLGYNALGGLLKVASDTKIPLDSLKRSLKPFTETAAGFLGYAGLPTLHNFVVEGTGLIRQTNSRQEAIAILNALTTYANLLHGFSLCYFPWKDGLKHKVKHNT